MDRRNAMIWGALVADAASMGLHWLYDQPRIAKVAGDAPEFIAPDHAHYADVPGYFAHPTRRCGDVSHYGEQALVMLRCLSEQGAYDPEGYAAEFRATFGYGGSFTGYIDRATRDTLDKMAVLEKAEDTATLPGSTDVQLPATSKLPALIARHHGADELMQHVENAICMTNNNATSLAFGTLAAHMMSQAVETGAVNLADLAASAVPEAQAAVGPVLSRADETTAAVTAEIGMSCNLNYALPSIFHNLQNQTGFTAHIRTNIFAGGDTCGRAIILGAVSGAINGIGGPSGIPQEWIDRLPLKPEIERLIAQALHTV